MQIAEYGCRKPMPMTDTDVRLRIGPRTSASASALARDEWIGGLLESRDARIDGRCVALEPQAIFASMPRHVAGWFG